MRRVLVTDASSREGAMLVRALAAESGVARVVAVGLASPRPRADHKVLALPCDGELEDAPTVDTVVHLGHGAPIGRLRRLLRWCEERVERVLFESSGAIYQGGADEELDERAPLELSPQAPRWLRERLEADLAASAWLGSASFELAILRTAEGVAPTQEPLAHWIASFEGALSDDALVNLLSPRDRVRALVCAALGSAEGIFNVPGWDTLHLSELIDRAPRARPADRGAPFVPGVMNGARAADLLGYVPRFGIDGLSDVPSRIRPVASGPRTGRQGCARHRVSP